MRAIYMAVGWVEYNETQRGLHQIWVSRCSTQPTVLPWGKRYRTLPAVKIGRFAVHKDFKKNGYGSNIMDFIKIWFITRNKTGCRFIIVDALEEALPFYKKNGFSLLSNDDIGRSTRLMYFDLKLIMQTD